MSIRIPQDTYKRVARLGQQQDRSVNWVVARMVTEYLTRDKPADIVRILAAAEEEEQGG